MIIALPEKEADKALKIISESGEKAYIIGELKKGEKAVNII